MNLVTRASRSRSVVMGVAAGVLFVCAGAASAETGSDAFRMMVISDQAFGQALIAGNHDRAIDLIEGTGKGTLNRFETSNNLCVAYVLADDPVNARSACEEAVKSSRSQPRRDRAIALSNRGVVRALTGDAVGALEDLRRAARMNTEIQEAADNLNRLEARINQSIAAR